MGIVRYVCEYVPGGHLNYSLSFLLVVVAVPCVATILPPHGVSFTTVRLPVRKYRSVNTRHDTVNDMLSHAIVNIPRSGVFTERTVESKER